MINFKSNFFCFVAVFFLVAIPRTVVAQEIMYKDEAGNIHFVDHISEVPRQYRDQLLKGHRLNSSKGSQANAAQRQPTPTTRPTPKPPPPPVNHQKRTGHSEKPKNTNEAVNPLSTGDTPPGAIGGT